MRALTIEALEIAVKHGHLEVARELGDTSTRLANKIKSHDYSQEDALTARVDAIVKKIQIKLYGRFFYAPHK